MKNSSEYLKLIYLLKFLYLKLIEVIGRYKRWYKMKCETCKKEITSTEAIQHVDESEHTTVHVFCSKECEKIWIDEHKKK